MKCVVMTRRGHVKMIPAQAISKYSLLGAAGTQAQNIQRDLLKQIDKTTLDIGLQPYHVEIPIWDFKLLEKTTMQFPIHPIHELCAAIYSCGEEVFADFFLGSDGHAALEKFWANTAHAPWSRDHPVRDKPHLLPFTVPITEHGDEGLYCKNDGDCVLVRSIHGELTELMSDLTRLLESALPCAIICEGTIEALIAAQEWGWECAYQGIWPVLDHLRRPITEATGRHRFARRGEFLAGPYRFAYAGSLGDWKYLKEVWHLADHYNADCCCHKCRAHKKNPALLFTDTGPDAGWAGTVYSNDDFWQKHTDIPPPLKRRKGSHVELVRGDVQHTGHLGVTKIINAQCIVDLSNEGFFGPIALPLSVRLRSAYVGFKAWCRSNRICCSQPAFTVSRLNVNRSFDFPEFASLAKSHNMRVVAAWVADVCSMAAKDNVNSRYQQLRAVCAWAHAEFYSAMEQAPRYLSAAQANRISEAGATFLRTYNTLRKLAELDARPAWAIRPKFHQLDHMCLDVARDRYNPRFYHCYADEDFVGRIMRISRRCHKRCVGRRCLQLWQLRLRALISKKHRDKSARK